MSYFSENHKGSLLISNSRAEFICYFPHNSLNIKNKTKIVDHIDRVLRIRYENTVLLS